MYHFDKQIQYQNDEEYQSQFLSLFGLEKYDDDTHVLIMDMLRTLSFYYNNGI